MDATEFLTAAYLDALSEVIEHYTGVRPVTTACESNDPSGLGSVVGFADEQVKGSSVLTAGAAEVLALSPTPDADPGDWLGELNNQVVGRLKNKAVPGGLLFQLSPPVTADGAAVRFRVADAVSAHYSASWPGGTVRALLALTVPAGLFLNPDDATVVAEEGSLNLF